MVTAVNHCVSHWILLEVFRVSRQHCFNTSGHISQLHRKLNYLLHNKNYQCILFTGQCIICRPRASYYIYLTSSPNRPSQNCSLPVWWSNLLSRNHRFSRTLTYFCLSVQWKELHTSLSRSWYSATDSKRLETALLTEKTCQNDFPQSRDGHETWKLENRRS